MDASPVFSEVHIMQETHPEKEQPGATDKVLLSLQAHYSIS
jgi:hypothetical protein